MVESSNNPQNPLEEAAQIREAKEAQNLSEAKALEMVPDFKLQLGTLIAAKIPAPEVVTKKISSADMSDTHSVNNAYNQGRRKLGTLLIAKIPLKGGKTGSVTISSSDYPNLEDPDSQKALDYEIDVHGLGRVLIIEGSDAKVQSKEWVNSWPAWSRNAAEQDILGYQKMLESLNQEGVTFTGTTPPIIKKDYSEIQSQFKLPARS